MNAAASLSIVPRVGFPGLTSSTSHYPRVWHGCDSQGHDGLTSAFLWSWQPPREGAEKKKELRDRKTDASSVFYLGKHSRRGRDQDMNKWRGSIPAF